MSRPSTRSGQLSQTTNSISQLADRRNKSIQTQNRKRYSNYARNSPVTMKETALDESAIVGDPKELSPAESDLDAVFRREYPVAWWVTLLGPFLFTLLILVVIGVFKGPAFVGRLVTTAVATFFVFGKLVILGGTNGEVDVIHSFFTTEELVVLVLYLDLVTACVLTFHLGFLFKMPLIGSKLTELVLDGQFILHTNPWIKRTTFLGLVLFVFLPGPATGSTGASIIGRLLGMSRLGTFVAIVLGSLLGCAGYYLGAEFIRPYIAGENRTFVIGGAVVLVGLVLLLNYRYRQLKSRYLTTHPIAKAHYGSDTSGHHHE